MRKGGEKDVRRGHTTARPSSRDKERGEIPQRRPELPASGFAGMPAGGRLNPAAIGRDDRQQPGQHTGFREGDLSASRWRPWDSFSRGYTSGGGRIRTSAGVGPPPSWAASGKRDQRTKTPRSPNPRNTSRTPFRSGPIVICDRGYWFFREDYLSSVGRLADILGPQGYIPRRPTCPYLSTILVGLLLPSAGSPCWTGAERHTRRARMAQDGCGGHPSMGGYVSRVCRGFDSSLRGRMRIG